MNQISKPVSELIKSSKSSASADDATGKFKTREEWRKAKELDEARKAGTAPAAVDEEGKDINPHIPQYISSAPWYIESQGPTLKHQRPQEKLKGSQVASIHEYYERGVKLASATVTKFRKGSCENCGAMTHKRKDCLERPRKIGAKFTNDSIAPDEQLLPDLNLDYDGKRDRWAGFDPTMYKAAVVDEYEKVEEAKRHLKEEKMKQDLIEMELKGTDESQSTDPLVGPAGPPGSSNDEEEVKKVEDSDDDDNDEEEKYADHVDMPGTKVDSKQRITVRNLRIREDVAKYLRNLDPDSAYYDPKTRSMRDDPYKNSSRNKPDVYAGENFVRFSGDTTKVLEAQKFAWNANDKGLDVHLMAEPTKAELLHKQYKIASSEIKDQVKESIIEKYGGSEHLKVPPPELIFAQTESYVEYSRQGKIVKGIEKVPIKSIYEEDVFINNHTSVWGSFWHEGAWGYKCCHSMIKNSYCTGSSGINAVEQTSREMLDTLKNLSQTTEAQGDDPGCSKAAAESKESENEKSQEEEEKDIRSVTEKKRKKKSKKNKSKKSKKKRRRDSSSSSSSSDEETSDGLNKKKLKEAIERQKRIEQGFEADERKLNYNSRYEVKEISEEELEAFRLRQTRSEDPMSKF